MFIDHLTDKNYDIAIVGAGAAGITLAHKLSEDKKLSILLVETGDKTYNEAAQKQAEVDAEGDFQSQYFSLHSQRVLGGTTSVWSNWSSMLELRGFMNGEWPIEFSDIHPYYEEATDIIRLRSGAFTHTNASFTERDSIHYRPFYKGIKKSTRFAEVFYDELDNAKNIDVLLNTTCIQVQQKDQRIHNLLLKPTQGDQPSFNAKALRYILACGGIGNPRLLQLSDIGKNLPVGKYLMEHPHFRDAGHIEVDIDKIKPVLYTSKTVQALRFSDQFCLDNGFLNYSISFKDRHTEKDSYLFGKKRSVFSSIATARTEMPALTTNSTYLSKQLNHWGQPQQKVHLKLDYTAQAKKLWRIFAKEMLVSGIGRLSEFDEDNVRISGGGHLMGTTRMGNKHENSVVDGNCKVHDIDNLYIAGSSIFAAGSAYNPTYSIVAFALRLAEHLRLKAA